MKPIRIGIDAGQQPENYNGEKCRPWFAGSATWESSDPNALLESLPMGIMCDQGPDTRLLSHADVHQDIPSPRLVRAYGPRDATEQGSIKRNRIRRSSGV